MRRKSKILMRSIALVMGIPTVPICAGNSITQIGRDAVTQALVTMKTQASGFVAKAKHYAKNKELQSRLLKGGLLVAAAISAVALSKYYNRFYVFKDGMVGKSRGLVIVYENGIQVKVDDQIGGTCGFHALTNCLLIGDALKNNNNDLSSKLRKSRDDLFISQWQEQYRQGSHGAWRAEIEQRRKDLNRGSSEGEFVKVSSDWLDAHELVGLLLRAEKSNELNISDASFCNKIVIHAPMDNYYFSMRNETGSKILGKDAIKEHIENFKKDSSENILPIIVHARWKHWIADVIYKGKNNQLQHIIADSKNWIQLYNSPIKQLMAIADKA